MSPRQIPRKNMTKGSSTLGSTELTKEELNSTSEKYKVHQNNIYPEQLKEKHHKHITYQARTRSTTSPRLQEPRGYTNLKHETMLANNQGHNLPSKPSITQFSFYFSHHTC
jgi:hypothetical protein